MQGGGGRTIARYCSPAKRRRSGRPSAPCDVKRYLQRAQLAALLKFSPDTGGFGSLVAGLFQAIALDVQDIAEERIAVTLGGCE
jgi:hypothetical protein